MTDREQIEILRKDLANETTLRLLAEKLIAETTQLDVIPETLKRQFIQVSGYCIIPDTGAHGQKFRGCIPVDLIQGIKEEQDELVLMNVLRQDESGDTVSVILLLDQTLDEVVAMLK